MTSFAKRTLSRICLPATKPPWALEMVLGRTSVSHLKFSNSLIHHTHDETNGSKVFSLNNILFFRDQTHISLTHANINDVSLEQLTDHLLQITLNTISTILKESHGETI